MDEYTYTLECTGCEVEMTLVIQGEDEYPCFCPMCGEDVNENWIDSESTE